MKAVLQKLNWDYVTILMLVSATHGLFLLNDGVYWDGWLIYSNLIQKNFANIYSDFIEGGAPATLYFHWLMGYLPGVIFGYRLVAFGSLALSGVLIYKVGCESGLISRMEALWISLLSVSYPAMQVAFELINVPAVFYYGLFLLGILLALRSERAMGFSHYKGRIGALVSFFVSFTINSLLVFYVGFFLVLLGQAGRRKERSVKQLLTCFLPRRLDYVALPPLFWGVKEFFFPRHGLYAEYNEFQLWAGGFIGSSSAFVINAIYGQLTEAVGGLLGQPVLALAVLAATYWAYGAFRIHSVRFFESRVEPQRILAFGVFLLGLGIFPYVAVGMAPTLHGWSSRHALLVGLPMAIITLSIVRKVFSRGEIGLRRPGFMFLVMLVAAYTISMANNYIGWQARWIKDHSIMAKLSGMKEFKQFSIFWIDDQFQVGGENSYRFYEWSSLFKAVWGGESRIGLDTRHYMPRFLVDGHRYFNKRYNLSEFDPKGCQTVLSIRRGRQVYSNIELAGRYFFYKFFRPGRMDDFLTGVTEIQFQPVSAPEAVDCRMH